MQASNPDSDGNSFDRAGSFVLATVLAVGTVLRAWLAITDEGIYWPDEIFQSLEPAHELVFGYGIRAWEYLAGARTWAFPAFLAGSMKLAALLGAREPREYLIPIRLMLVGISTATAAGVYVAARGLRADRLSAAAGAAVFSLSAPAIYFAPRALSEVASGLPVMFGLALALRAGASVRDLALGTSLLGLAAVLRLQSAVFAVLLVVTLLVRRDRAGARLATGVLGLWGLGLGLLDRLTWGDWFQSARVYLHFNLVDQRAAQWGTQPPWYYLETLLRSTELAGIVLLVLAAVGARRAGGLVTAGAGFVLVHSIIPHKEFRFVLPAMPLLCAAAGVGLDLLRRRFGLRPALAVTVIALVAVSWSAVTFRALTFADLGHHGPVRGSDSAYGAFGAVNRLLLLAHGQADLCGLKVETAHLAWTGGQSYLHRPVPLYGDTGPDRSSGHFNYVIALERTVPPTDVVRRDGHLVLAHVGPGRCIPDERYRWELK